MHNDALKGCNDITMKEGHTRQRNEGSQRRRIEEEEEEMRTMTRFRWKHDANDGRRKPAATMWVEREDSNDIIGRVEEG
jgi:hypothetical protein